MDFGLIIYIINSELVKILNFDRLYIIPSVFWISAAGAKKSVKYDQ